MGLLRTILIALFAVFSLTGAANLVSAGENFPRPAELEPDIAFWTRVYTEINTAQGFLHDSRHLGVVYETLTVGADVSRRVRQKQVDRVKDRYRVVLRKLAGGQRSGLSNEEQRVLALWPADVSNKELRAAADRLRFQLGQADRFRAGMVRAGAWMGFIAERFAAMGLPPELVWLPHVESSFNPDAYSHAGAAGLWQFTRPTGRRFMRIDTVVDERMDPFLATNAAGQLLLDNHSQLNSWPLALTAYNHGVAGMRRAVRKLGTTDFATIARNYKSRSFGFASRNFYPSFLAVLDIESDPERYFGSVQREQPLHYEVVELDAYVTAGTLARVLELDEKDLAQANRAFRKAVWNGDKYVPRDYPIRVPAGFSPEPAHQRLATIPPAEQHAQQRPDQTYRVQRGDTLSQIAGRFGVSTRSIVQMNGLRSAHAIRIGQQLRLPLTGGWTGSQSSAALPLPADGHYTVRSGDSLSRIASRFGLNEQELARHNNLRNKHRIYPGQKLALPGQASGKTSDQRPNTYTVRRGDTLSGIAARFGLSERALAAANGLADKHRIFIGQVLLIDALADDNKPTELALSTELTTPQTIQGESTR